MPVKTFRPLTPSTRYITFADFGDITKPAEKGWSRSAKPADAIYGRATAAASAAVTNKNPARRF
jgi:hypothetical protein